MFNYLIKKKTMKKYLFRLTFRPNGIATEGLAVALIENNEILCFLLLRNINDNRKCGEILYKLFSFDYRLIFAIIDRGSLTTLKLLHFYESNYSSEFYDSRDALFRAIHKEHWDIVRWMLTTKKDGGKGVDVNIKEGSKQKNSPIHYVVMYGELETLRWMIDKFGDELDVTAQDWLEKTPLHLAVERDNLTIVQILVHSRKPGQLFADMRDRVGWTALHRAVYFNNLIAIKWLIEYSTEFGGVLDLMTRDNGGYALLHTAARRNNLDIIKWLVKPVNEGGAGLNLEDREGNGGTVLHSTVKWGRLELVKWLCKPKEFGGYEADPVIEESIGQSSKHPADMGFFFCNETTPNLIVGGGVDVDAKDFIGYTIIHHAIIWGFTDMVQFLAKSKKYGGGGANVELQDNYGNTALMLAVKRDRQDIVKWLLIDKNLGGGGANMKVTDNADKTILITAIKKGQSDLIKWFILHHEKNVLDDKANFSELHLAVMQDDFEKLGILVKSNAKGTIDCKDLYGYTPLHYAIFLLKSMSTIMWLVNSIEEGGCGANVEICDAENNTALLLAWKEGRNYIFKWLATSKKLKGGGADVKAKDRDGCTVIHHLCKKINGLRTLKWLTEHSESEEVDTALGIRDNLGRTALYNAVEGNLVDIVDWLIRPREEGGRGVDENVKDNNGLSPLEFAVKLKRNNIVQYFDLSKEDRKQWTMKSKVL